MAVSDHREPARLNAKSDRRIDARIRELGLSRGQAGHDLRHRVRRDDADFVVGSILNGVRYEHTDRLDAERSRLRFGAVDEGLGRDEDGGDAPAFELRRVVHTARRAASSVGERFDDRIAPGGDLVPEIDRRRLGEGRFLEPLHGGP